MNMLEIPQGAGSGFLWDREGHVVTNYHVITDASDIQVGVLAGSPTQAACLLWHMAAMCEQAGWWQHRARRCRLQVSGVCMHQCASSPSCLGSRRLTAHQSGGVLLQDSCVCCLAPAGDIDWWL